MQNGFYPPPQRNYYTYAPAKPDHRQKRKNVELENGSPIDLLPPKKKSKAKKKKIKEPEDPNAPPKPKRKTGLNKPLILSTALSAVMDGDTELSRPELVKKLWKYIKEHELQDPVDRRYILCDEKLKLVFGGQDRVNSFTMNRDLSAHLTKKTEGQKDTSVSPALTADTPDDIVVTPKEGEVIQSSMSSS
ncbi:SWIB/MDM2 domain-containing protein [Radiomyces spectabilis]|uniref:SWIB/MDM2 domain-containing protein n=1 Tax=Radiomyces spectabilis TaxID=64574 RepID=UPI00221EAC01|nr:SWIB/MDM2 domain-containing protein [Radiomyces spectabilis]KAI8364709.1 SWIB/MDM2 domain-containing protein [Radiomyces spectabilis]